ncbi:MAG: hypothetical protein DKM23_02550 [Candidatus Melainabacteria bacterium]|nr:MAG: hypothetical protein DKM23_02550 [Candidatus Melainabacteria bacterium]
MEINKTSAQKLDNNVQVAQATTTKPAIKTAEGTSFKDAVSMMSDIEVANNTKTDIKPANPTETVGKNADAVKDFKFISTTENKTSFDKTLNKENLTQNQKLSIHEKAEKELVKEIVLVNNKQIELKANKNENQIAQVSTAIKSDKEIETEKNDKSKLHKDNSNESDLLDLSSNNRNQQSNLNDNAEVTSDIDTVEISNNSDNLKMTEDLVIDKTTKNDIPVDLDIVNTVFSDKLTETPDNEVAGTVAKATDKPEVAGTTAKADLVDTKITEKPEVAGTVAEKADNVEVVGSIANAETKSLDIVKDEAVTNVTKNNIKANLSQNNVKNEKVEVKNVETKDVKPVVTDEIEFVASDKFAKNTSSPEKINTVSNNIKSLLKDEKTSKTEKTNNKKLVITNSKVDNDTNIIKNTVATEVGEIKPVDLNKTEKPAKDMKVITFAPISPVQDLKENLTTSKTSDIVKFIDANLSTTNTKKAGKSNSASSARKAEEKSIKMTEADAKFFQNLVENNNQVSQDSKATDMANQATLKDVEEAHSAKVSKSLLNALKESQETNKSFRVDFDKDLSVILKVNRNGRISAEFLPGDAAVEQYLKSNIPLLKQKFNDEGLEYENLSYRDQSRKDNKEEKRNNRNSNKENGYE